MGLLVDTLQVTVLDAGQQVNVIPAEARAQVDIRLLPDTDRDHFLAQVDTALGPTVAYRILLDSPEAPASPVNGLFFGELRRLLENDSKSAAPVTQWVSSGVTDSRYFRERSVAAYGFSPFGLDGESTKGIHASDESISLAVFEGGVATYRRVLSALAGPVGQ
jgi:carboxypeptidase PM20D1